MSGPNTVSGRVATRWCGPNPFGGVRPELPKGQTAVPAQKRRISAQQDMGSSMRRGAGKAPGSVATRRRASNPSVDVSPKRSHGKAAAPVCKLRVPAPQNLGSALVELLHADLQRGYWRVAIRHYLMLIGCGYEVPALLQQQCIRKMALCAPVELQEICDGVEGWFDLREDHRIRTSRAQQKPSSAACNGSTGSGVAEPCAGIA